MTQTYMEMADIILKKRKAAKQKINRMQQKQIKIQFVNYILNNKCFSNIIDLIIEYYNLDIDTNDNQFVLEEILKQDGVTSVHIPVIPNSVTPSSVSRNEVTFRNIFGLDIGFVFYSDNSNTVRCDIRKLDAFTKSTSIDIDRDTLATFVADYREEQG